MIIIMRRCTLFAIQCHVLDFHLFAGDLKVTLWTD